MRVRRSPFTAAALLGATALLVGCGADEPEPKFEAEPSPSTSVSMSPSPSVTPDRETAEEFIRRWVDASTELQRTGETRQLLEMSKGCDACRGFAERVDAIYSDGGFVDTAGWKIVRIERDVQGPGQVMLRVHVSMAMLRSPLVAN